MIRIAIVEDEPQMLEQELAMLERYGRERTLELKITPFRDGDTVVNGYRPEYDVILMDIQMELLDGMTAAKVIRKQDQEVIIIFITNMAQYAIQGYTVDAMDYVLKPVSYFALSQRLDRALERLHNRRKHYIVVPVKGGAQRVDLSQVRYVESRGHSLIFRTRTEEIQSSGTMKEMEDLLLEHGFFRSNKGYLLNLDHVEAVRDGCAIVGEEQLLISRSRKNALLEALANHLAGRSK